MRWGRGEAGGAVGEAVGGRGTSPSALPPNNAYVWRPLDCLMLRVQVEAPAPHVAHARLAARHPTTFLLESRTGPKRLARYSLVGWAPAGTVELGPAGLRVQG